MIRHGEPFPATGVGVSKGIATYPPTCEHRNVCASCHGGVMTRPTCAHGTKVETCNSEDCAFEFRHSMLENSKARGLSHWRVLTRDSAVAYRVSQLMGGAPEECESSKVMELHVLTEVSSVEIVIDGSDSIDCKMISWGRSGPTHECDGQIFLSPPESKGKSCGCPVPIAERKKCARSGRGPGPHITVMFRLAHDYKLGRGKFVSGAWKMATAIHEVKDGLDGIEGEALCRMELEHVQVIGKEGVDLEYRNPTITVLGSYNSAGTP